jgi:hypothetical protein
MTIASAKNIPRNTYTATAGQTAFTIGFEFYAIADVKVYKNGTLMTYAAEPTTVTEYNVTGITNESDDAYEFGNGGTVTFGSGLDLNDSIVIIRDITIERNTDFNPSGAFDISTLNTQLDTITSILADTQQQTNRSVKLLDTDTTSATVTLPTNATRASKVLSFDASGNIETTISASGLSTLSAIPSDITTVAGIASDVSTVAANDANITIVATNINDVITVANDLNEAISEIETAALDLQEATSEIDVVATDIANVNTVGTNISNVNTVATNIADVNTVATNISNVNTVAGIDTDVTAVAGNETNITAVSANSSNINTVAGNSTNINTVAGISANVTTVAGISSDVTTVSGISADVSTVAADGTDIGTVATNISNVNAVASNETNINAVNSNSSNINAVAGNATNINTVAGNTANITTVATNIADVNNFADVYRISATAPTTSLDVGDLYFDTTDDVLKVYSSTGWVNAGSSVNGTSARFQYSVSSSTTTISGVDDNGETLAYDAGYIDVYLNGVKMVNGTDVTVTSGTSVVFATAIGTSGTDSVDIIAYGTFEITSVPASAITSGTLGTNRGGTGLSTTGSADEVLQMNSGGTALEYGKVQAANLDVADNGTAGQYLSSDGDGSFSWVTISNEGYLTHTNTIANDKTIDSGYNAISGGPVTINSSVTVTVTSGSNWTII